MSLTVVAPEHVESSPARAGVPAVPPWALSRWRLHHQLDLGTASALTVVTAPTGAGKSLGVASWAAGTSSTPALVWLDLRHGGTESDRVWPQLVRRLHQAGAFDVPPGRKASGSVRARERSLIELGEALREHEPWTVVLDGFPAGPPAGLGAELELLLDHAGGALRFVLLSRDEPALDLHRYAAAGELVRVSETDLVLDAEEVGEALRLAVARVDRPTVDAVVERTLGWACGVRRVAVELAGGLALSDALQEADAAVRDYLVGEVLRPMTPDLRSLVVGASVVGRVPGAFVRSVLGKDAALEVDRAAAASGLVQRRPDGSLTCHPLLHAAELCATDQEWADVAAVLVEGHAIPRLVTGSADDALVRAAERVAAHTAEPLVRAAVAVGDADLPRARAAYAAYVDDSTPAAPATALAAAFVELGIARLSGTSIGAAYADSRANALLATLDDPSDAAELAVLLDALTGSAEVTVGQLDRAATTLSRGAADCGRTRLPSALDCAGQLALLEACRGNLEEAVRRASIVLTATGPEQEGRGPGVAHAQLAMAWVHTDRGELSEATAALARATGAGQEGGDRWLQVARVLVEARLLVASGRADEALRRTTSAPAPEPGWLRDQLTAVSAEALLAAGEPRQALALVTEELDADSVERAVMTAVARRELGDLRGAGAAIAPAAHDLLGAARATQLEGWLLEARVAHDRGQLDRARVLVERVLRSAAAEQLRRPLTRDGAWLRWFLDRSGTATREHRRFVRSLVARDTVVRSPEPHSVGPAPLMTNPLTEREGQVLELVAQLCTTDEIAAEMYLSVNTVKTHLSSIFRKFGVSRRGDAVRRGRELGLC